MDDVFSLSSSAIPEDVRLVSFRGTEAINRPYEYEVYFILHNHPEFDMADAVGGKATIQADRNDGGQPFCVHGIFATMKHIREAEGHALYRGVLVPSLWHLTQTRHSRLFTKMSIPKIVEVTLLDGGLTTDDFEMRLDQSYEDEEHVCQYHESHLDFIHRWLEMEGMYYFFEQKDDRELMVITDHRSFHSDVTGGTIRYRPVTSHDASAGAAFDSFSCQRNALPASVSLRDYDYAKPSLEVSGTAEVSPTGTGEWSIYGGRFFTPDQGKRLAKIRAEEFLAREEAYHASGTVLLLHPGAVFELEEHARDAFNKKYQVIEVEHVGNQASSSTPQFKKLVPIEGDEVYRVSLSAIPATTQYRPPRVTAWPRIYGYENGVIDGEATSEYAQVDDDGRYLVKFHFDESDLKDGKASTFVRMMQPHGGVTEGWHFPLRKGTEVLITFLGGDPDRPVIAGAVPNAHTPSPVTSANHTTNVIQTGGRNRFELEDQDGSQRVTLSTPTKGTFLRMGAYNDDHNCILNTDGRSLINAGQDLDVTVGGYKKEVVTGLVEETYNDTKTEKVESGQTTEHYKAQETNVANLRKQSFGTLTTDVNTGSWTHHVHGGGSVTETYDSPVTITVNATRSDTVTGSVTETYGARTTTVNGQWQATVNGLWKVTASNIDHTNLGNWNEATFGGFAKMTLAVTSETLIGIKNENLIGGKIESLVGLKLELHAALTAAFGASADLRESPGTISYGSTFTIINGKAAINVVTPVLTVPAASIILV